MPKQRKFLLAHQPCRGTVHKLRDGRVETCNRKTHPGGTVHIHPLDLSWRQGISRSRIEDIFGIDLKPGEKAFVFVKVAKVPKKLCRLIGGLLR